MSPPRQVQVVLNPIAGAGKSQHLFASVIAPLLDLYGVSHRIHITQSERDPVRIGEELSSTEGEDLTILVLGGDGTAHELIEGIVGASNSSSGVSIRFVIVPSGTANALHASLFPSPPTTFESKVKEWLDQHEIDDTTRKSLGSLAALLAGKDLPRRLAISLVTLTEGNKTEPRLTIPSHVVVSTALHANLLKTSDELRSSIPGIERFKEAAARNVGIFHPALLRSSPSSSGAAVRRYDPPSSSFHEIQSTSRDGPTGQIEIGGPFSYVLATTTVDRLEPDPPFLISPLVTRIPRKEDEMDVIVLRPGRDPLLAGLISKGKQSFSAQEWDNLDQEVRDKVINAWPARAQSAVMRAYGKGEHVDLVYPPRDAEGGAGATGPHISVRESSGADEPVVEVYRCGGWTWTPTDSEHAASHTVCIDGSIQTISPGGSVSVKVQENSNNGPQFHVYA